MSVLGFRAFAVELIKIATEVRDPDIRAMLASAKGKEYLPGGQLGTNSESETSFKPKLAVSYAWIKDHVRRGVQNSSTDRVNRFVNRMGVRKVTSKSGLVKQKAEEAIRGANKHLGNRRMHEYLTKKAAGFMAFTPVGTYNVLGKKKPEAQPGSAYESASGTAGAALRGGMTGAAVATLGHTLRHGHELKLAPRHLGKAVIIGSGVALADRTLRRHTVKKQLESVKTANLAPTAGFSPAKQLQATNQQGSFEPKVHHTPLKAPGSMVGRNFRMPTQGA